MGLIAQAEQALACSRELGGNRTTLFHAEKRGAVRLPPRPGVRTRLSFEPPVSSPARLLDISRSGARIATAAPCRHSNSPVSEAQEPVRPVPARTECTGRYHRTRG